MTLVYDAPKKDNCLGKTQAGTRVLYDYCRHRWPLGNTGTYNCRPTAMGTPSCHAEGRAGDLGVEVSQNKPLGDEVAAWLVEHAEALGVQGVIWNHQAWGFGHPPGWHLYGGTDPHTRHVHFEQNWNGALHLTLADIEAIDEGDDMPLTDEDVKKIARAVLSNNEQMFNGTTLDERLNQLGNALDSIDGRLKKLEN